MISCVLLDQRLIPCRISQEFLQICVTGKSIESGSGLLPVKYENVSKNTLTSFKTVEMKDKGGQLNQTDLKKHKLSPPAPPDFNF